MIKRIAFAGLLVSAFFVTGRLYGTPIKIPVKPYQSRNDEFYRSLVYRTAITPTSVNQAARRYILSNGVNVPDTLRVLCIRVEFPEDDDPTTWGNGKMDLVGFGSPADGLYYDPPHDKSYFENQMEGLRNFYLLNSHGRLVVEYDVYPEEPFGAYQVPHQMSFYGDTSNMDRGLTLFMRDALISASQDPDIDFSLYHYVVNDAAGSDTFDMVIIFHAGSTAQSSFWYGYTSDLASATITPNALEAYTGLPYVLVNGVQMRTASIVPESPRVEGVMTGLPGMHYHEFAHLLGAYDLYDVLGYTQGVGAWSLMGGGGWLGFPAGQIPSMHEAFHRYWFGWEDPIEVVRDTTIALYSAEFDTLLNPDWEAGNRPTLIKVPIRQKEYFLIENRQTDFAAKDTVEVDVKGGVPVWVVDGEYDAFQPGSGVIIWHVDEDLVDDYGHINAINVWEAFGGHKGVDMEEADGIQDYDILFATSGIYATQGSEFDAFYVGGNAEFGPNTNPSSDGYYGETGITIRVLDEPDTVMRVEISFEGRVGDFPQQAATLDEMGSVYASDIDGDGAKELLALGTMGDISHLYAWEADGSPYVGQNGLSLWLNEPVTLDLALGDVDGDGIAEIVLTTDAGGISVYDPDTLVGSNIVLKPGFPFFMQGRSFAAPMLADLNGDSRPDIVSADEFGNVYAIAVNDDTAAVLSGFPVSTGEEVRPGFALVEESPVAFAMLTSSGLLYLFNSQGELADGFPVNLGSGSAQCEVPPVVADVDGDGQREIVVFAYEYNQYRYDVVSLEGEVEFSSTRLFQPSLTAPALADLDADGSLDIVFASGNGLWALDGSGSVLSGFPVVFPETYEDRQLIEYGGFLYFVTFNAPFSFRNSPVIADFDADGEAEIAIGAPDNGVYLVNPGAREPYSELYTRYGIDALAVDDLDSDGRLEVIAGTSPSPDTGAMVHLWETSGSILAWGQWMHDAAHTGLLTDDFTAPPIPSHPLSELYVYPNPARDDAYLHLRLGTVDDLIVQFIDASGRLVSTFDPEFYPDAVNDIVLDEILPDLVPGFYIVRVEAISGEEKTIELYKLGVIR